MSCAQPSCLIPEFTPECTDDCLVVACDDPEHGSPACLVTNGEIPCDGTCITAAACSDCTGLDEIVSTLPNPAAVSHPPRSSSVAPTTTPTSWTKSPSGNPHFPNCLATASNRAPSPSRSKLSSPTPRCLLPLPPLPLSLHFHHRSMLPPPLPSPRSLSHACGQLVVAHSTTCQIS